MSLPHIDELTGSLVSYLPYLVSAGKTVGGGALKSIGDKLGDKASQALEALWLRLRPKLDAQPALKTAAEELADSPQNPRLQDELRKELRQLLENDAEFMKEVAQLLDRVVAQGIVVSNTEIGLHSGEFEGVAVEDLGDVRDAGIREIRANTRIQETKEGSSTTGVRIGRVGGANRLTTSPDEE